MSIPRPKTSFVWEYFSINTTQQHLATCNLCQKEIVRGQPGKPKEFSTSNLSTHLRSKHPTEYTSIQNQKLSHSPSASTSSPLSCQLSTLSIQPTLLQCLSRTQEWQHDHPTASKIHHAIGSMIATDIQPIQMVENEGFKNLIGILEPRYKIPSRKFFSENVLPNLFQQVNIKIKQLMNGNAGISFTVDLWTAEYTTQSYMSLTAHWLTSAFHRKAAVLQCELFEAQHTANQISTTFLRMLDKWSISISNCHLVLHDNGANIIKAFRDINNIEHASCFAHTLQLVIKDGLLSQRFVIDILSTSRTLVGHFKHSSSATSQLHKLQQDLNLTPTQLIQDVPTRWNSSFYLLKRLVELRKPVSLYCSENDTVTNLTPHQWTVAGNVVSILTPFEELTRDVSNASASISLVIPAVKALTAFVTLSENDKGVKTMKSEILDSIQQRFNKLEHTSAFSVSTLLDPRFKTRCFSSESVSDKAKGCLFLSKYVMESEDDSCVILTEEPNPKRQRVQIAHDGSPWSCLDQVLSSTQVTQMPKSKIEIELNTYLAESLLPRTNDPLIWWQANQNRFPLLAPIARTYLASPPTSVPSERVFSTAGDVISEHRSRLLPSNAETLILLKFNLPLLKDD
jgi:hypothetical protein